ncbi:hypothetical protein ACFLQ2_00560 [archaeon]
MAEKPGVPEAPKLKKKKKKKKGFKLKFSPEERKQQARKALHSLPELDERVAEGLMRHEFDAWMGETYGDVSQSLLEAKWDVFSDLMRDWNQQERKKAEAEKERLRQEREKEWLAKAEKEKALEEERLEAAQKNAKEHVASLDFNQMDSEYLERLYAVVAERGRKPVYLKTRQQQGVDEDQAEFEHAELVKLKSEIGDFANAKRREEEAKRQAKEKRKKAQEEKEARFREEKRKQEQEEGRKSGVWAAASGEITKRSPHEQAKKNALIRRMIAKKKSAKSRPKPEPKPEPMDLLKGFDPELANKIAEGLFVSTDLLPVENKKPNEMQGIDAKRKQSQNHYYVYCDASVLGGEEGKNVFLGYIPALKRESSEFNKQKSKFYETALYKWLNKQHVSPDHPLAHVEFSPKMLGMASEHPVLVKAALQKVVGMLKPDFKARWGLVSSPLRDIRGAFGEKGRVFSVRIDKKDLHHVLVDLGK